MLTCVFHPIDPMRVIEEDEAQRLLETGFWFDCPAKAKKYRERVETEINEEAKDSLLEEEKPKVGRPKGKLREQKK